MAGASDADAPKLKGALLAAGNLIGLLQEDPESWFQSGGADIDNAEIERLIAERQKAKENKDYALADKIRDDLIAKGVMLEDGPDGTKWKVAG